MKSLATFLTSAVALALGLFGAVSVQAQTTPQEQFTNAINAINAQLGPFDAIKAPPPFSDPENRARYEAARAAMAQFGTDAFPVNGMISFYQVFAPINAAAVKHMFVGISAQKKPDMTQEQFANAIGLPVATLRNWEQGRNGIDPAGKSLLILIARDPEGVLSALAAARAA